MNIHIVNCFNWVGFHLTTYFLENGYNVIGYQESEVKNADYLELFIGRNSQFTLQDKYCEEKVDSGCIIEVQEEFIYIIHHIKESHSNFKYKTKIIANHLFGEWMPKSSCETMLEIQSNNEYMYINDFIKYINKIIDFPQQKNLYQVYSNDSIHRQELLPNGVFIIESVPQIKRIQALKLHIKKHSFYYSECGLLE